MTKNNNMINDFDEACIKDIAILVLNFVLFNWERKKDR